MGGSGTAMAKLKKVYQEHFAKKQNKSDDQDSLNNACKARGGVWNTEDQLCYGIKNGKKRPIGEKNG